MPCYESSKSVMTVTCYKSGNDKSDNNENKVCLLLKRWGLVSHILNYMLDQILDHMLASHAKSHDNRSCDHGIIKEKISWFKIFVK